MEYQTLSQGAVAKIECSAARFGWNRETLDVALRSAGNSQLSFGEVFQHFLEIFFDRKRYQFFPVIQSECHICKTVTERTEIEESQQMMSKFTEEDSRSKESLTLAEQLGKALRDRNDNVLKECASAICNGEKSLGDSYLSALDFGPEFQFLCIDQIRISYQQAQGVVSKGLQISSRISFCQRANTQKVLALPPSQRFSTRVLKLTFGIVAYVRHVAMKISRLDYHTFESAGHFITVVPNFAEYK